MPGPEAGREIELKLVVEPDHLTRLAAWLRHRPASFPATAAKHLESRYFDTSDHRLASLGVALRVRRIGDSFIQTLKATSEGGGAHTVRGEWECAVAGMTPELDRIVEPEALDRLGPILPEELEPVFTTEVERHIVLVEQPVPDATPSIIEVAFDAGKIIAGDRTEPIAEIELELKAGPTVGLYGLLRKLRQVAPVTIAVAGKARRGYCLASAEPPPAVRATRPDLEPAASVGEALAAVLVNCLGHWLENVAVAEDGRDSAGLHQLRIAVRRTRSALSLFADAIGGEQQEAWNERLRAVLALTSRARELDVFLDETLVALEGVDLEGAMTGIDATAAAAVRARALAARADAYAALRGYLGSREHADLVLDLADWLAFEGWRDGASAAGCELLDGPLMALAGPLLRQRHKRVRKLGRDFARLDDDARHEVRLALKKLRYGVDFLGGLFPAKAAKRYAKAAAALQDALGRLNDRAECQKLLLELRSAADSDTACQHRLDLERGIGFIIGWQVQAMAAERRAAEKAWRAFVAQKPFWQAAE